MESSRPSSDRLAVEGLELFTKDGVYHLRISHYSMPDTIEVALHGISTREEAIAAAGTLSNFVSEFKAES